jgi:hypothetical protein
MKFLPTRKLPIDLFLVKAFNMAEKDFGLSDFPEHRSNLEEQAAHLGMEAAHVA